MTAFAWGVLAGWVSFVMLGVVMVRRGIPSALRPAQVRGESREAEQVLG